MKLLTIGTTLGLLFSNSVVWGQDIDRLLVTGSRINTQSLYQQSSLERVDIERINPQNTIDLLEAIPHLLISQNGSAGGQSFVSIRGGESNFTLVLIDGVAVNNPTNSRGGGFDFNLLDPDAIERIDVYRGGISAIYGGDALSGVIHFITRTSEQMSVRAEAGNQGQLNANLTVSAEISLDNTALFSLSRSKQKQSEFEQQATTQLMGKLAHLSDKMQHGLLVTYSKSDNSAFGEDSGGASYANPHVAERRDAQQWVVGINSAYQLQDNLSLHTSLSWQSHQSSTQSPGIAEGVFNGIPASDIDTKHRTSEAEAYLNWQQTKQLSWVAGVHGKKAQGSNTGELDFGFPLPVSFKLEQEIYSAFVESAVKINAWSIDFGVRLDDASGFANELSLRTNVDYKIGNQTSLYVGYNEGFKLPSFFALAHPLIGNPELRPEQVKSLETGLHTHYGIIEAINLSVYFSEFADLVDFDPERFSSVNRGKVTAKGLEAMLEVSFTSWLSLNADVNWQQTDIEGESAELRRRPRLFGDIRLNATFEQIVLHLAFISRSQVTDSSIPTGIVKLGGYSNVNLGAQWQLNDAITLTFNLDNILDKTYAQSIGFEVDDMKGRAGFRYVF